jgi:hypothetical protein
MGPAGETCEWIVHDAKVTLLPAPAGRLLEQLSVKRHRLKQQHSKFRKRDIRASWVLRKSGTQSLPSPSSANQSPFARRMA